MARRALPRQLSRLIDSAAEGRVERIDTYGMEMQLHLYSRALPEVAPSAPGGPTLSRARGTATGEPTGAFGGPPHSQYRLSC